MKRRKVVWNWEHPDAQRVFADWVGFPDARRTAEEVDRIEALLGAQPPGRVLDIGCGTGRHAVEMARRSYAVVAIDVAQGYLEAAKQAAQESGVEVEFRLQRGSELEEEQVYDIAIAFNHTLGFMSDDELSRHFGRTRAALKPQGKLLLVLAGPRTTPDMQTGLVKNWAEKAGRFILSQKHVDERGFRHEHNIVVDTEAGEIVEYVERQKAFSLDEVTGILHRTGFGSVRALADLDGASAAPDRFGVFVALA